MDVLVTVITLAYNSEYLRDTIDSVLSQTYGRIQYIVVDDGSKEFLAEEIYAYIQSKKEANIAEHIVYQNPTNIGTVQSYNRALEKARGEYIFNLAADDVFYDDKVLEEWVERFVKTGSGIMTAYRAVYDKELKGCKEVLPQKSQVELLKQKDAANQFENLAIGNFVFGCSTARSMENIKKYGKCSEDYRLIDDYPINLLLTRNGVCIDFWDRIVIKYRLGGVSSPENFNDIYEKDSDLILKKEILCYTKYPLKRWYQYHKWKYWHSGEGKIRFYQHKYKDNRSKRILVYLRYPIHALRALKNKKKTKD
ncbi:MAG: glycosyltransferase [Lachnospiraceae bacterium]|nr:glycosyltransferase [Lachnospiraceae bacterium]